MCSVAYISRDVFEPETVLAMGQAVDAACQILFLTDRDGREAVALAVYALARRGENDPERLLAAAVRACGSEAHAA